MTERGPSTGTRGGPDPAEPSKPGASTAPASRQGAPADLGAVRRTDAIIESLAARRAAGSAPRSGAGTDTARPRQADDPDPAVRLLHALISDVDDTGPDREAGPETTPPPPAPSGPGSRRRGPRTIVALGVAGAVLASTGVAVAGGDVADRSSAAPAPSTTAGPSDDADRTADTDTDTDTGTHTRPRPPARPAPERPGPAPKPSGDRADGEEPEPRPRHPFPPGDRPRLPDIPAITVQSPPPRTPGDRSDDTRRHLDDLRKRAQEELNRHRNNRHRD